MLRFYYITHQLTTGCSAMPNHTISEAARLVGKHRSTIQKHIREGKLSKLLDDEGNPFIETSELLRVYKNVSLANEKSSRVAADNLHLTTPSSTPSVAELETALLHEKNQREKAEALLKKTEESEAGWKEIADRLSLLLTDQRDQEKNQDHSDRYKKFMKKISHTY